MADDGKLMTAPECLLRAQAMLKSAERQATPERSMGNAAIARGWVLLADSISLQDQFKEWGPIASD